MSTVQSHRGPREAFRHQAFMYAGLDEFVAGMTAFIRDGVAAGAPTLVVVSRPKIDLLRSVLDGHADGVLFADMAEVGSNPARIIPAWRDFVTERSVPGRPLRGIGEPISPERSASELVECQRHESLLNLAFADTPGFWLLCPYDTGALDPAVIESARRTHPSVVEHGVAQPSDAYDGLAAVAEPFADPLPEPPAHAAEVEVRLDALAGLRRFISAHAAAARLSAERTLDLLVAVNEIATNSVRHGGGRGLLRLWREPDALVCEVRDQGRIDKPLAGRERPQRAQVGGYGLWLANQLCDLVQVRSYPTGNVVRLHMRRP